MTELKPGWQRVTFGEMAECINDRVDNPAEAGVDRYVGLEHLDPESLKIRRWGSPDDVESTKLRFRPGDIIFGKRRAYQRKLAVADFEGICSAHAMVLRAKTRSALPDFLPFFMQSELFMRRAIEISVGSLSPTINWKTLSGQEFWLPPQEEQKSILNLLRANYEAHEQYRDAIMAIEVLAESQLLSASNQLEGYESAPLAELVPDNAPICYGVVQPGDAVSSGTRMIRVCDIDSDGNLAPLNEIALVSPQVDSRHRRSRLASGDIVISVVGTIGRVARIPPELSGANIARALARIRVDSPRAEPEFVARLLRAPQWQRKLTADSFETARKTLNISSLGSLLIPLPPISVQIKYIEGWLSIEQARLKAGRRLASLRHQRSLLLSRCGFQ